VAFLRGDIAILGGLALVGVGVASDTAPDFSPLHGFGRSLYILAIAWWLIALLHWAFEMRRSSQKRLIGAEDLRRVAPVSAAPSSGRYDALRRARDEARKAAPPADIRMRVSGNTASEQWRRWLHLYVENMSPTIAKGARIRIRVRPFSPMETDWMWTRAREEVDLVQGSPVAVPIVICDVREPPAPNLPKNLLYRHEHLPIGKWFLTSQGHLNLGKLGELPPGVRYFLDVTLIWSDGSTVQPPLTDWFILDIPSGTQREAEIIHTVGRERF